MPKRLDEEIKLDVVDAIYWDDRVNAADVKVDVVNGEVSLGGSLATFGARMAAQEDAWSVEGVRTVNNALTVSPTHEVPSDDEIHERLSDTLLWSSDIDSTKVNISVLSGTVNLTGSVSALWKKDRVDQLVAGIDGVTQIKNDLTIVPTKSYVDIEIARDIETALHRNIYVDAEDVTVQVSNGAARLTGEQPTWYARDIAGETAALTSGVLNVTNEIAVA